MAFSNNSTANNSNFRLEDGKVLGRIKPGVKLASPSAGNQDYRFFVEPLSPVPGRFEEAEKVGFTGFMSRIGYDCSFFASEEEAWETLNHDWGDGLVLFTPAMRNNKYFVIEDLQKEKKPDSWDGESAFVPAPVFMIDKNPIFDGDLNKFILHIRDGKPLPGLSKRYWDDQVVPPAVMAGFTGKEGHFLYAAFAPLQGESFREVTISEGGAYFPIQGDQPLGMLTLDLASSEIRGQVVLCKTAPLCFFTQEASKWVQDHLKPLPEHHEAPVKASSLAGRKKGQKDSKTVKENKDTKAVKEQKETKAAKEPKDTKAAKETKDTKAAKELKDMKAVKETKDTKAAAAVRPAVQVQAGKTSAMPVKNITLPAEQPVKSAPVQEKPAADTEKMFLNRLCRTAAAEGLLYEDRDLINFHVSVKSSRLVILAGMSGTGKSRLVTLYGETLGLPPEQVRVLPVRPSWMDDGDILGYLDLEHMIYRPADTGLADLLREAAQHPEKLYMVCFDEMNLARAEHYFAQFISVLEKRDSGQVIRLYNPALEPRVYNRSEYPSELPAGRNILFTGTINVDESTYHFSDKILDRANVITLHQGKFQDLKKLRGKQEAVKNPEMTAPEFFKFVKNKTGLSMSDQELEFLDALNTVMKDSDIQAGIGFRIVEQMDRYLANIPESSGISRGEALDNQVVQRILTKFRGSADQMKTLLTLDEGGKLAGKAPEVFSHYGKLSSFTESWRVLSKKAGALKSYDYTI